MNHRDEELTVHPFSTLTEIHDLPIPSGPDELVIRVIVAGSNVKGTLIRFQLDYSKVQDKKICNSANPSFIHPASGP